MRRRIWTAFLAATLVAGLARPADRLDEPKPVTGAPRRAKPKVKLRIERRVRDSEDNSNS